ncbi:MAG: hypothetical protein XD94_1689 [Mesotoga prima]|uniref:Uncharacterized protein n=1 Tax=Mesotoga prima TaxID=1184387 RepID=A0A124FXM8_9BACT|nr:MAG: hypothetical protein XD94_1689 [Mesotoga prima]
MKHLSPSQYNLEMILRDHNLLNSWILVTEADDYASRVPVIRSAMSSWVSSPFL